MRESNRNKILNFVFRKENDRLEVAIHYYLRQISTYIDSLRGKLASFKTYLRSPADSILTSAVSRLVGLVVAVILAVAVLVLRDAMSAGAALELGRSAERLAVAASGLRRRAGRRRARRRRGLG